MITIRERINIAKDEKKYKKRYEIMKYQSKGQKQIVIERIDGRDRCSLIMKSHDETQLNELKQSLESRGIKATIMNGIYGRQAYVFGLVMPMSNGIIKVDIKKDFENFLDRLQEDFVYGKPINDYDFFTSEEKDILERWYRHPIL